MQDWTLLVKHLLTLSLQCVVFGFSTTRSGFGVCKSVDGQHHHRCDDLWGRARRLWQQRGESHPRQGFVLKFLFNRACLEIYSVECREKSNSTRKPAHSDVPCHCASRGTMLRPTPGEKRCLSARNAHLVRTCCVVSCIGLCPLHRYN